MHCFLNAIVLSLCLIFAGGACKSPQETRPASKADPQWPGLQSDGSMLLPNLWSLRPVGKQVPLGDFPVNIAVHPSGKWAAVLHSGYGDHEITILQISSGEIVSRVTLNETFYGIAF